MSCQGTQSAIRTDNLKTLSSFWRISSFHFRARDFRFGDKFPQWAANFSLNSKRTMSRSRRVLGSTCMMQKHAPRLLQIKTQFHSINGRSPLSHCALHETFSVAKFNHISFAADVKNSSLPCFVERERRRARTRNVIFPYHESPERRRHLSFLEITYY